VAYCYQHSAVTVLLYCLPKCLRATVTSHVAKPVLPQQASLHKSLDPQKKFTRSEKHSLDLIFLRRSS